MRWKIRALALPLLAMLALRVAVAPIGDAIAGAIAYAAPAPAKTAVPPPAVTAVPDVDDDEEEGEEPFGPPRRIASRMAAPHRTNVEEAKDAGAARPAVPDTAPKATIVVPASAVIRAMEKRDVSAANAVAPDGTPLGARLAGVSRYRTGLRDGDIVISVGGTRTPNVEALVSAGMQAASGGAARITGRVLRGEATYAVILELPKPPP